MSLQNTETTRESYQRALSWKGGRMRKIIDKIHNATWYQRVINKMQNTDWHLWSTIIIAVATVANVYVSCSIGNYTRESMEITRNIFKADNRPYVGIFEVKVEKNLDSKEIIVESIIKNAGSVPARDVVIEAKLFINKKKFRINRTS
jgi:hypothetical protein